jgi:tripartite-type tricarboxylate transporter receptor subunit TctC
VRYARRLSARGSRQGATRHEPFQADDLPAASLRCSSTRLAAPGTAGRPARQLPPPAAPDGYTLLVENFTGHAINATLQAKMPFDSLRDFVHISLLAWVPDAIVSLPSLPAKNVQEFIALAKAQPGKLTYASFGVGSSAHMAGELFKIMAGVDILHVPYKGGGPAITDLLAGQVSVYIPVLPRWYRT